ncbi:hypothetical protein HNP84_008733 [Thermocatellispora tengchongensis]|uniref:Uncharacterized protein n=1 Tax=Thermocatellispora tengchongensis TaxID=1073253 RepID=A0A840PMF6_9ACTN|nr:hypothetical protein [Thermocatellispora tengchongensis]MBB5138971.1 hypothetical protein [Thermocatellispora tengchongensis]
MRGFPTRLLAANALITAMLWAGFVAVVAIVAVGIGLFGTLGRSVWEPASQFVRFYALFFGIALVREWMPLYLAHGRTRRLFGLHGGITIALFAPFLAVLAALAYLVERGAYALADVPQNLDRRHLFTDPLQVHLVLAEYSLQYLAWIAAGALVGAAFYRWEGGGLLVIPLGVVIVALGEAATGDALPLIGERLGLALPQIPAVAALGAALLGAALTWMIVRDVPVRNRA